VTGSGSEDGYSEDRVPLRWPVVLLLVGLPVLGVVVPPGVGLPLLVIWFCFPCTWVLRCWPVGLRLDAGGVHSGGVTRPGRRTGRRPLPAFQGSAVFTALWESVRAIEVVTDTARLRDLRSLSGSVPGPGSRRWRQPFETDVRLGVLTAPFMRAALVLQVDLDAVTAPPIRPGVGSQKTMLSSTWVVPTRHPDQLRAALVRLRPGAARP